MAVYQVLDEENNPVAEYGSFYNAMQSAEDMTLWDEDHYYHVEAVEMLDEPVVVDDYEIEEIYNYI